MSAEVTATEKRAVARARYGVRPPYAIGTRVTLSDLLFYKPYGSFPTTVEEAAPHAHPTERLRADEKLGVYWESYGTDPSGEKMSVSLTVVQEVEESGFLRRQAKALKLVRAATPVSVSVQDISARGSSVSARALELDISTLKKGSYIVQLEVEVAGQYIVRADHTSRSSVRDRHGARVVSARERRLPAVVAPPAFFLWPCPRCAESTGRRARHADAPTHCAEEEAGCQARL